MAEFKITRFRYTWKENWSGDSTLYYKDDVVYHEGSTWVCIRQHNPGVFADDQAYIAPGDTNSSPAWVKMADGRKFLGIWQSATRYEPGVIVISGGNLYLCLTSHVSSVNFNSDDVKWDLFAVGSNFRNEWLPSTRYRVGDVIRYNGYTYQCTLEHTSGLDSEGVIVGDNDSLEDSTAETWTTVVENYTYTGNYQTNTRYRKNDLVKYGGSILKCITEHTSGSSISNFDGSKFSIYLSGYEYDSEWNSSTYYAIGDVVRYGGTLYVAVEHNNNSVPGASEEFQLENPAWNIVHKGINFAGFYDPQSLYLYKQGDVVRRGGTLWVCLTNQVANDDSTLTSIDDSNWEVVIEAQNFRGSWRVNEYYNLYDVVYFKGVVYYANIPNLSSFENFPGDNGEGINYWTEVIVGNQNAALTILGDLLTYNLSRSTIEDGSTIGTIGDGSTFGATPISIGQEDQLLVVENNQGSIGYKTWGTVQRLFFVRTNGVDDITDPARGHNYFKPWKTVRFALEQADDGFEGTTLIKVSTGEYQEVLPLIVPARTAIIGEELRSVTIKANDPIPALANDAAYTVETLTRIGLIISNIIQGIIVSASPGNTEIQITTVSGSSSTASLVSELWTDIIDVINYKVFDIGSSMPTVTGSNTITSDTQRVLATTILENNRDYIKAEAIAYMAFENPDYSFDTVKCLRDMDKFIDAVIYDLTYTGNYKSVLAGRYYSNAVIGSALEDMFYVRNETGLRNLSLKGLEGTLPAQVEGETYQIPTGGAFVSLDPGWGPDDERVWITSRSCYVQNVTTFGTGAVGQKIDGLLHNGGYKSIVSNDFTQIISDGIGAWVQNGGRAELVSVFTYYCHVGMFAKDGGIIRATNGNSSYGDFGAVADGIDPDEVVRYGYVNTQTEQAVISSAFAGEILDFILGLEFQNCGQNYTTAEYTISSSGAGASAVQEEFRDNSMFECQIVTYGSGFTQYGNQAQFGNELQIALATAETATEEEILGMRIIIISGEGTGQYGYVYAYNPTTKICTVYRESDDQPGWDHVLPGTPSATLLTTGSRYRIEPRPTFTEPPYSAEEVTLDSANIWAAAVYGETSRVFTGVQTSMGAGETIEVTPAPAEFTVTKIGRNYTYDLTDGGAGYAVGDIITIDGSDLGGISGEHDINLEVTDVSDDSTNSILAYKASDPTIIADSGKFILTPATGHFGRYSSNGSTWTSFDLPTEGNWKCLAAGNNKFVAIRNSSNAAASSTDGITWTARTMPASRDWRGVAYGKPSGVSTGIFVAVAGNLNAGAYSINGETWTSTTLPTAGDSTLCEWTDIAFGAGVFVALANEQNVVAVGTWDGTTLSWTSAVMDVIADSSRKQWVSIAYGNRRFVAISDTGDIAYSFDGLTWLSATMPTQDGSTIHNWKQVKYGQGVFFAVGDTGSKDVAADPTTGPTTFAATSYDGIVWTPRILATEENWGIVAFGNPDITLNDSTLINSKPTWVVVPTTSSDVVNRVYTGARALGRVVVDGGGISYMKIWEPGSGYVIEPNLSIYDPSQTSTVGYRPRLADGVLAQPTFLTKGSSYKTSTTYVTVTGDGFADITPNGRYITVDGLEVMPGPGAQFYIGGREDFFIAVIVGINEQLLEDGTIRATFQVSPRPKLTDYLEHGMEILIREKYSQVRITGHDFLDVGTGNFIETNYPDLYRNYEFTTQPFQEVQNLNGGRVFYTSTDQDGNFRAGDQFAVEQATGIITISADFFDLSGLTELRLAGINVGSTAIIREFSKDPLFLQNSNNVIPTQRAIRAYLQSRLNIGGEDLLTPSIIAGTVKVGPNLIASTAELTVNVPVLANFSGSGVGLSGSIVAQTMFFRSFKPA